MNHLKLLALYAEELSTAKLIAEIWWEKLLKVNGIEGETTTVHRSNLDLRWPEGAASHPRVLAAIRKYWLACDALNQSRNLEFLDNTAQPEPVYTLQFEHEITPSADEIVVDNFVDPHIFVSEWLIDEYDDLASFIGRLSYWPIGLDDQDNYT
jgi:hypothetical protein